MGDRFLVAKDRAHTVLCRAEHKHWAGAFTFVQLADTQLGMLNAAWNDRRESDVRDWKRRVMREGGR